MSRLRMLEFHRRMLRARDEAALASILAEEFVRQGFRRAVVFRRSQDGQAFVTLAVAGATPTPLVGERSLIAKSRHTQKAIAHRAPILFYPSDIRAYGPDAIHEVVSTGDATAWIESPVEVGAEIVGVVVADIDADTDLERGGTGLSTKLVTAYADHVPLIRELADHQLTSRAHSRLVDLDAELAEQLRVESVDDSTIVRLDSTLSALASGVVDITGATCCDISIARNEVYVPIAQAGSLAGIGRAAEDQEAASGSISMESIRTGRPVFFVGKRNDEFYANMLESTPAADRELLMRQRAWGAMPIVVGQVCVGALSVCSDDWDFFAPWRVSALSLFASKAALAVSIDQLVVLETDRVQHHKESVGELTLRLNDLARRAGIADGARTVVHNLANMVAPLYTNFSDIQRWSSGRRGKFPQRALDGLAEKLEQMEKVFEFYRRLRGDAGERRYYPINDLVNQALAFNEARAESKGVQITLREAANRPLVMCSDVEMLQVFMNVIGNAIDAVTEGGSGDRVDIRVWYNEGKVGVRVSDEGIGIKHSDQSRVWGGDVSTKRSKGGTGLGLPYVKRVVEAHGGTVELESMYQKGTQVTILLPARLRGENDSGHGRR